MKDKLYEVNKFLQEKRANMSEEEWNEYVENIIPIVCFNMFTSFKWQYTPLLKINENQ